MPAESRGGRSLRAAPARARDVLLQGLVDLGLVAAAARGVHAVAEPFEDDRGDGFRRERSGKLDVAQEKLLAADAGDGDLSGELCPREAAMEFGKQCAAAEEFGFSRLGRGEEAHRAARPEQPRELAPRDGPRRRTCGRSR